MINLVTAGWNECIITCYHKKIIFQNDSDNLQAKEEDDMAEPPEKRSNCELDDDEKKIQNSTKESFIKRTKEEKVAMKNKIFTDITISRPVLPIPGHTGYLTFASWYS